MMPPPNEFAPAPVSAGTALESVAAPAGPLLAIETATPTTRVALLDGRTGAVLSAASARVAPSERHSSHLLRLCVEVMAATGVGAAGLGAIACDAGPGSFTGLRVGMAVGKGLALPTGTPFITVSSLEILAEDWLESAARSSDAAGGAATVGGSPRIRLVPCIDAGKGQLFAAVFVLDADAAHVVQAAETVSVVPGELGPALGLAEDDEPLVLFGPGADRFHAELRATFGARLELAEIAGPTAESLGKRALARLAAGARDDLATVVPSYGRAPDITRPKPPRAR